MKGVIISLCIAAAIVTGSLIYTKHIDNVSERLSQMNITVRESLDREDFVSASAATKNIEDYLERQRTLLAATANHEELEQIEINIAEMRGYIGGEMKADAISRSNTLGFLFEHMPKNYKMHLENIL